MAIVKFKKPRPHDVVCVIEPPPLNLLSGKFRRKARPAEDEYEGYEGNYKVRLQLITDDSPIKRISIELISRQNNQAAGKYVMPVVFWELLRQQLPEFLAEVKQELGRLGVSPSSFTTNPPRRLLRGKTP